MFACVRLPAARHVVSVHCPSVTDDSNMHHPHDHDVSDPLTDRLGEMIRYEARRDGSPWIVFCLLGVGVYISIFAGRE